MSVNPSVLKWTNPNPYPVDIELGELESGEFVPKFIVVGELQGDEYVAPLADMAFDEGEHTIALRAIDPSRSAGNVSGWSESASFEIRTEAPAPPLAVRVE